MLIYYCISFHCCMSQSQSDLAADRKANSGMSLCRSNVLSTWSQTSRALVIQRMAPEWHVNVDALTDNLTWYWSSLLLSAKCAERQKRDPGGGFLRPVCRTWRNDTEKKCDTVFSGNSWNIKESLGGNFTLGVFIFRKTEHRQPIKICVHWGIPVPWHDNLLFKCTAAFLPYTTEQSRQLIHYHWAPSFSPSHHFSYTIPSFSAPPDHSLQLPRCENLPVFCCWTCKPDWTKSNSAGLRQRAALHAKVDIKRADIWRCYRRWINSKKVHQVLRGPCGFSLFMSIKHLWEWWYLVRLRRGLQPTVHSSRI